jgi:hypothetical protein
MCHRQFVDDDGSVWAVWDVNPARIWEALGTSTPAREADSGGEGTGRRRAGPLDHTLAAGWLCFESAGQKLRLAPIPADWEALASTDLALLRRAATAVRAKQTPTS